MIAEFHRKLALGEDISSLLQAINSVPALPSLADDHPLDLPLVEAALHVLTKYEQARNDKLNCRRILDFRDSIASVRSKEDTPFYESCLKQYEKFLHNIEYHVSCQISNFALNSLDLDALAWIRSNSPVTPDLDKRINEKFRDLIEIQIALKQDLSQSGSILIDTSVLTISVENQKLCLKSNSAVDKLSQIQTMLDGFLRLNDFLQLQLTDAIVDILANFYRQYCINHRIEQDAHAQFTEPMQRLLAKSDLLNILLKHQEFSNLDLIKQSLVKFKNKYVDHIDNLDFTPQNSNWKNFLFKQKQQNNFQKSQTQFFEDLLQDCKQLGQFICLNDPQVNSYVLDHFLLLDMLLQRRQFQPSFQMLNFFVSVYTQIEAWLLKLAEKSDDQNLLDFLLRVKIYQRNYSQEAAQFADL